MEIVIAVVACVLMALFAAGAFMIAQTEKRARYEIEKELKANEDQQNRAAEIIGEANKAKAQANSGDFDRDISYMAQRLHDHANK